MESDIVRRAAAISVMAEAFRQQATHITLEAYELGLNDIPAVEVEEAVKRAIRTHKFMPTVSELRELCGDSSAKDRAVIAWECFMRAVEEYGPYRTINFDDQIINATVRALGGWPDFSQRLGADPEKISWVRKEFTDTYCSLFNTGVSAEYGSALPGIGLVEVRDGKLELPQAIQVATGLPPVTTIRGDRLPHCIRGSMRVSGGMAVIRHIPGGSTP